MRLAILILRLAMFIHGNQYEHVRFVKISPNGNGW